MRTRYVAFPLSLVIVLGGCLTTSGPRKPPALSALQREAMQTKEISGDFETVFASVLSVLQDDGWQITEIAKDSGVIQANSLKRQALVGPEDDWRSPQDPSLKSIEKGAAIAQRKGLEFATWTRWKQLTAHIEPWGTKTVRVRISIVKYGTLPSGTQVRETGKLFSHTKQVKVAGKEQSVILEAPRPYQLLFQKIEKAVFVRKGLSGS